MDHESVVRVGVEAEADDALWPDFHHTLVQQIPRLPGPVVVHAPRGCGKTLLLRNLLVAQRLGREPVILVSGRDEAAAVEQLQAFCDQDSGRELSGILVDDLDHLLLGADRAARPPANLVRLLGELKRMASMRDALVCLATSTSPELMLEFGRRLSDVLTQGSPREILPWRFDWELVIRNALDSRFGERLGRDSVQVWGQRFEYSPAFVDDWCACLRSSTGGHPTLLGPAMALIVRLLEQSATLNEAPGRKEGAADTLVAALESELAVSGGPYLRRRIEALAGSGVTVDRAAFEFLRQVAGAEEAGTRAPDEPNVRIRLVLERDGLGFLDTAAGRFRTLCPLVRREVLQVEAPPRPQRAGGRRQLRGGVRVRVVAGTRDEEFLLPASSYQVLAVLAAHAGEIVPLEVLMEETETSRAGVLTAVHRLGERLREKQMRDVLENVYGKGYRLSVRRIIAPEEDALASE